MHACPLACSVATRSTWFTFISECWYNTSMGVECNVTPLGCCSNSIIHPFGVIITPHTDLDFYGVLQQHSNFNSVLRATHKKTDLRAAHEVLLMCYLLSCSTQSMGRVQCTKYSMCTAHKSWLMCNTLHVTCKFWLSHLTKIEEHTCV